MYRYTLAVILLISFLYAFHRNINMISDWGSVLPSILNDVTHHKVMCYSKELITL